MAEKPYVHIDSDEDDEDQYVNENGTISFEFADMEKSNRKVLTLSPYDPKLRHRVVYPGLNLEGTCRNQSCSVFEKNVWVKKEYGIFNIGEEINNCLCPICNQELPDETVRSVGYRNCKVKI
jgi:hypothetical protein